MKRNSGSILIVTSLTLAGSIFGGAMLYKRDACFDEWSGRVTGVKWSMTDGCMVYQQGTVKAWVKAKNYVGK